MHLKDNDSEMNVESDANVIHQIEDEDEAVFHDKLDEVSGVYQGPEHVVEEEKMEQLSEFVMGAANVVESTTEQELTEDKQVITPQRKRQHEP